MLLLCYIKIKIIVNTIHPGEVGTVIGNEYTWEMNTNQGELTAETWGDGWILVTQSKIEFNTYPSHLNET